jgi:hypothetical protein
VSEVSVIERQVVWTDQQVKAACIGPAHPNHPDFLKHYTPDGISLAENSNQSPHPELHELVWNGYGELGSLGVVMKSNRKHEA